MKTPPRLPRVLYTIIALIAVAFVIASVRNQRAGAAGSNGKIAFSNSNQIYTMNADGSGVVKLTPDDNGFQDRLPVWSPDGTKIAFGRGIFSPNAQIYVMNADGSNPTRLTNNSANDQNPSWSPDGTKIAFTSNRDGNDEIYVMNADGSNQTRLTNNAVADIDPAWSPDGTKIAFSSMRDQPSFELYVMGTDGSDPLRLTNNTSVDRGASWSPDGAKIAFTSQRDGLPLVYVMNANGSNQVNITQSTSLDSGDPEWSPDGTTIAFTSYNRVGQTNSDEIFLMNADGTNIRRITFTVFDEHDLAWQALGAAPTPTPTPSPSPSPSPSPLFTVSGTVTDDTAHPIADATLVLISDVTGTQITFSDQSGNYSIPYAGGVSHSLNISAFKAGYVFNPLALIFISSGTLTGDRTASFVGTPSIIPLSIQPPVLLTQDGSLRGLALDSVTNVSEPFGITGFNNFSTDQRTRVALFAVNIELGPGETSSVITAEAEDSLGAVFPMMVEDFRSVPNFPWLKQVVVKLPTEIANKVEVNVRLRVRGVAGNKVLVKVKP
jgi:WD40 repeat protein